ncbi:MAG: ATP-dependent helicase [Geminicoccaceae bacterium]|nr:ATP-dependent helicase [Geminicoccaceae bacterium]
MLKAPNRLGTAGGEEAIGSRDDELDPEQYAAVTFGIEGRPPRPAPPVLVLAGAGTGKTRTLVHRAVRLVACGADPERILLLTFTRRAAEEMVRRAEAACLRSASGRRPQRIGWAGTFHAIGARLLRIYAERVGLDPAFTILDRSDAADLLDLVREDEGLARTDRRFPRKETCLAVYSLAVETDEPLQEVLSRRFPWCAEWEDELRRLFRAYARAKASRNLLDYDDLLIAFERMARDPGLGRELRGRFDHVLVDEYQDTNPLQARILEALVPEGRGLFVVGDDAQAIYGFRGATVRNMREFPRRFPGATILRLEHNYRSVQPILDAANAVMSLAREGFPKKLWSTRASAQKPRLVYVRDGDAQAEYVARAILGAREEGTLLREMAVLFRAAHHSAALEVELARRNVPFRKYGGLKFLEAAHIKDVIAILRFAENPADRVAGLRVLQLLPGIGPSTARRLVERGLALGRGLAGLAALSPPVAARALWPDLVRLLEELEGATIWAGQIARVRRFYDPLLSERYDHPAARLADLDALDAIAARFSQRRDFLTELALDPPSASTAESETPSRDEDVLVLSTIHSAKGLEWKAVWILNCNDGCIPSDMACGSEAELEEERRVLYVAMTRAKDRLELLVPTRFYTSGQPRLGDRCVRAARSRFLPERILDRFEQVVAERLEDTDPPAPDGPRVDLRAALETMWE